jgi:hypothetical protein
MFVRPSRTWEKFLPRGLDSGAGVWLHVPDVQRPQKHSRAFRRVLTCCGHLGDSAENQKTRRTLAAS